MARPITEASEIRRLKRTYKDLPDNKNAIADGLIIEAARLRILINKLWEDIEENGTVERFSQSEDQEPYDRERPATRQYLTANKNYQTIIDKLDKMIPADLTNKKGSKLDKLMAEINGDG